jgi:hypothetical protein
MAPGDLVGAVVEVIVADAWRRLSMVSISAFFCTKIARAASFDLVFALLVLAIISGSVRLCGTDECFFVAA